MPPVLGRLLRGSFWLALRSPVQAIIAFWTVPLILKALGEDANGAYYFAWGFGFIQFLFEFGMSSALQRQVSDAWTRDDREGVDRAIACGAWFYAGMALVQAGVLIGFAYLALPHSGFRVGSDSYRLIFRLLWLQALTAPCYGMTTIVSSVLQAARRYDFIPRLEFGIVIVRFGILLAGLQMGVDFFAIVATMVAAQVGLSLIPATWVMVRDLGYVPRLRGARWSDYRGLFQISLYVFLIQLSVILADRLDKLVLGFALPEDTAGPATTVYEIVSKPFVQIRQTGWMLSYLVMPAVASLAASNDRAGLERIKYDGSRMLLGLLTPVALLAAIYAGPFLAVWIDPKYAAYAGLLRLFLLAVLPLAISVLVQMAVGMGKIEVIALAALGGAVINLPLSYWLTLRIGVAGVIWGTVLTTLLSNLLIPAIYTFRTLEVSPGRFLVRTLGPPLAGAAAASLACLALHAVLSPMADFGLGTDRIARAMALLVHLVVGTLAYIGGYALTPAGRGDLAAMAGRLRRRAGAG